MTFPAYHLTGAKTQSFFPTNHSAGTSTPLVLVKQI